MSHSPTKPSIQHGHLDQWDEYFPLTIHGHIDGDKKHYHKYTVIGGIGPKFRYVPPSLLKNPFVVADWSDTSDL